MGIKARSETREMATNKTLRLSHDKGLLCGVCGGIAEWLGWKPRAVRVLYVLLSIGTAAFPGIIVYAVLYLTLPEPERAQRSLRLATSQPQRDSLKLAPFSSRPQATSPCGRPVRPAHFFR